MLHLGGVRLHPPQIRCEYHRQLNVLADDTLKHVLHAMHYLVEVEGAWLDDLFAAEGQKLAHQLGGTRTCLANPGEVFLHRIGIGESQTQQVGEAVDDREQVVEVMRHAARQTTDGLHLLGSNELGGLHPLQSLQAFLQVLQ